MNFRIFCLLGVLVSVSCSHSTENDQTASLTSIKDAMAEQEKSWSQGDIAGFMKYYQNSADLSFATKNGLIKGHNTVLNRYKEAYSGKDEMGTLRFELLEHKSLGTDHMLIVGSWSLENNLTNPSGHFSLIWKNMPDGWRIIHDHTS